MCHRPPRRHSPHARQATSLTSPPAPAKSAFPLTTRPQMTPSGFHRAFVHTCASPPALKFLRTGRAWFTLQLSGGGPRGLAFRVSPYRRTGMMERQCFVKHKEEGRAEVGMESSRKHNYVNSDRDPEHSLYVLRSKLNVQSNLMISKCSRFEDPI